jgi:hypothetical protein
MGFELPNFSTSPFVCTPCVGSQFARDFGYGRAAWIAEQVLLSWTEVNKMFTQWTGHDATLNGEEAVELLKALPAGVQEATYKAIAQVNQILLAHLFATPYEN